jgi:ribonuclease HI
MKYFGVTLDCKLDWYPHTQYLENKVLPVRNSLVRCSTATWGMTFHNLMTFYKYAILPVITYASESWSTSVSKRAKCKLQKIQRAFLIFITKAYKSVSNEALSASAGIMPIEQDMQLHKDRRAISRGNPTNAVIAALKKIETPAKTRGIHPKDNHISVDLSGTVGNANMKIFTDGSKTENHVGASMVAEKDSKEIHTNTQRLNTTCTVFQAELYGISTAIDWIQSQGKKTSSYAINADSKAALLANANMHTTHPLAVAIRVKTIKLRNSTSINFHWVKRHAGLKGNERADYLAKTVARYNNTIAYDEIPINREKQIL